MYKIIETSNKNKIVVPFKGKYNKIMFGNIEIDNLKVTSSPLLEKGQIIICKKIIRKLNLDKNAEYKLIKKNNTIEFGPLIGLLLGSRTMSYNSKYMEKYLDRFIDFNEIKGSVVAFSIDSIDYKTKTVHGLVYNPNLNKFELGKSALPKFIYRRNFHQGDYVIERLKKYSYITNESRITKDLFYKMLKKSKVKEHLPFTEEYTNDNIKKSLSKNKNLILKPLGLSRGRGIIVIECKLENQFIITNYVEEKEVYLFDYNSAIVYLLKHDLENYLIQEYISLEEYKGLKYDIRVVVQKEELSKYKVSGIEVRLSKQGELLTNYSLGGQIVTLKEALEDKWEYDKYKRDIEELSIDVANIINRNIKSYELGLDLAISKTGKLYLIEANSLPSFKGFKEIDIKTYLNIRKNPLIYGSNNLGYK